jgi:rod shape determining protein RodA
MHSQTTLLQLLHLDTPLLVGLLLLATLGLLILYSASNQDLIIISRQLYRFLLAFLLMFFLAQISPTKYQSLAPWLYLFTAGLLFIVLAIGIIGKGAQRWLSVGLLHFQPAELMKIGLPLMVAWYLRDATLPLNNRNLLMLSILIAIPILLIAKQPDLGTAMLIAGASMATILLAGLSWRLITSLGCVMLLGTPILWHFMREYQRNRVLTFLNPERDPLGSGYHIIQSKIAIGSGGLYGKGWLQGTQSHLQFLPEHATDFIFAVCGEEFGLIGASILLSIYLAICLRGLYISLQAQNTFSRILAGGISLTFFISVFINIGMVIGILPVVGLPLPLVSYGGTSMLTMLASFGILMSIHTHRRLISG